MFKIQLHAISVTITSGSLYHLVFGRLHQKTFFGASAMQSVSKKQTSLNSA